MGNRVASTSQGVTQWPTQRYLIINLNPDGRVQALEVNSRISMRTRGTGRASPPLPSRANRFRDIESLEKWHGGMELLRTRFRFH